MDSGLGSDEDRRSKCSRTKEQKQLINQQLMSGTHTPVSSTATEGVNGACFIDASSLQDDDDVQQQEQFRKLEERRQGALLFQTSIPQYSTLLQPPTGSNEENDDPDTPFNSIVHIPTTEEEEVRRPALGFYVDLADIDVPIEPVSSNEEDKVDKKKNMFSMVIDFEAPKKEKPTRLGRVRRKSSGNGGATSEYGSDGSSSLGWLGAHADGCEQRVLRNNESGEVGSEECVVEKNVGVDNTRVRAGGKGDQQAEGGGDVSTKEVKFVRLSDLEQPSPSSQEDQPPSQQREAQSAQPQALHRMSRSIPESSWLESPLSLMSRSTGYYRGGVSSSTKEAVKDRRKVGGTAMKQGISNGDDGGGSISLSDSTGSKTGVSQKRLGTDLLRMFLEEIDTDVVLHIGNRSIKAHRCILISRCQYFAGTLRQRTLTLDGFSYEAVHFALCHIYSGAAHVPQSISLVELASLSDLLALEGLKEVVAHELRSRHCHHFHPPCASGCITGVLEVLPLAASYALDGLYHRCLRWIHQHYVHVWPSRAFSRLPSDFQQRCLQQHVVHLSPDTVLGTLLGAGQILEALPASCSSSSKTTSSSTSSHWASALRDLVHRLQEECANWIKGQFEAVLGYIPLVAGEMDKFEETLLAVIDLLALDQACRSYGRCLSLLANSNISATCTIKDFQQTFVPPPALPLHICLLLKIRNRLEMLLMIRMDRLLRSVTWTKLDPALRAKIKQLFDSYKVDDNLITGQGRVYQRHVNSSISHISHSSSSESSSRNSSPATSQIHTSPSLRRSLLLAAKSPQQQLQVQVLVPVVPPSPAAVRKSTLTQPTASSAAKSTKEGGQVTKQQIYAKTPGNTISKSYHHYTKHQTTTTQTTIIQPNAITHTKSAGSITITNKPRGESPTLAKRQIPIRKTTSTTTANQLQQQSNKNESSPLVLRKTASGSSLGSRKWEAAGSCSVGGSTGVVSKKQSPVNCGTGMVVGHGGGNKRQSPVMARYLLPRQRDLINNDTPNQPNKTTSSTSPISSPRMRTKSAETAKVQTTKPQKHPQGSVSNTHSPAKTINLLPSGHSPVKLKKQQVLQDLQQHSPSKHKTGTQVLVVNSGQVKINSPKSGSPGKARGRSERDRIGDNMRGKKEELVNGERMQKMWKDKESASKDKDCEDKMKRLKPGPRTNIDHPRSRSDSPVNFDMTETIVVNSKPITRPANFDSSLPTTAWDDTGPVSLKSLVGAVGGTSTGTPGMALLTRSGTFLKDEPSVLGTLDS